MQFLIFIAGVIYLFAVLLDAFQTIILPRRATGRFRRLSLIVPTRTTAGSSTAAATIAGG